MFHPDSGGHGTGQPKAVLRAFLPSFLLAICFIRHLGNRDWSCGRAGGTKGLYATALGHMVTLSHSSLFHSLAMHLITTQIHQPCGLRLENRLHHAIRSLHRADTAGACSWTGSRLQGRAGLRDRQSGGFRVLVRVHNQDMCTPACSQHKALSMANAWTSRSYVLPFWALDSQIPTFQQGDQTVSCHSHSEPLSKTNFILRFSAEGCDRSV